VDLWICVVGSCVFEQLNTSVAELCLCAVANRREYILCVTVEESRTDELSVNLIEVVPIT
jgi:hypothetical protein